MARLIVLKIKQRDRHRQQTALYALIKYQCTGMVLKNTINNLSEKETTILVQSYTGRDENY